MQLMFMLRVSDDLQIYLQIMQKLKIWLHKFSRGWDSPVLSLSYLTRLRIQKLKFLWSWHPGVFSSRKNDNENLLHMKQHLLLIHNMCATVMGIWLNESSFAAQPDMNPFWKVTALPQALQHPLSVKFISLSHMMAKVPSHSLKSLQHIGKWQARDAVLLWFIWASRCWVLEIH